MTAVQESELRRHKAEFRRQKSEGNSSSGKALRRPFCFENRWCPGDSGQPPLGMIIYHTMATTKVAITVESETLREIDHWVREGRFPNRSRAVQTALAEMLARRKRRRLVEELGKLNSRQERALAEELLSGEPAWPEY